jgi:hypothetical protein
MAAAADPTTKLYYNDYNIEYGEAKTNGAIRIVKLVQSYGVKIDGVGLQGHMVSEPTNTQKTICPNQAKLTQVLESYTALGVDVAYTEVDIRLNTPTNAQKQQANAKSYGDMMGSCMAVKRCVGFTIWVCCTSLFTAIGRGSNLTDYHFRVSPTSTPGSPAPSAVRVTLSSGITTTERSQTTRRLWMLSTRHLSCKSAWLDRWESPGPFMYKVPGIVGLVVTCIYSVEMK